MSKIIDARRESYFVIDTETLDTADTAIVMDVSCVFVNLNRLFIKHFEMDNYNPINFKAFSEGDWIDKISLFPNIDEQKNMGLTVSKESLQFWKDQLKDTDDDKYKSYIKHMIKTNGKQSVKETTDQFEEFIIKNQENIPSTYQSRGEIPYLERSGGFDTNKYYNLLLKQGLPNHKSHMKYWARREIRTIISCNRWRIPEIYLKNGTTSWSEEMRDILKKQKGDDFTPHIAINDCLIDAYMIYLLKMSIDNFYI